MLIIVDRKVVQLVERLPPELPKTNWDNLTEKGDKNLPFIDQILKQRANILLILNQKLLSAMTTQPTAYFLIKPIKLIIIL